MAELGRNNKVQQNKSKIKGPCDFKEKDFDDKPTVGDYAKTSFLMATLPIPVLKALAIGPFKWMRGSDPDIPLKDEVWQAVMDHFSLNCTWRQIRILCPLRPLRKELQLYKYTTLSGYNDYFGGTDYSARWFNEVHERSLEDPVILYLHGGSYALKTQRPQLVYIGKLAKMLQTYRVSILILDYTIGPFAKFPTQLDEAMSCYKDLKKSCNNIIALGDSSGGHLALSMLQSGARFDGGMVLVSPSTDMTNDAPDDVSMREVFVDPTRYELTDPIISPLYADPAIWPKVLPKNTAVVWGSAEICKPQMIEWAKLAKVESTFEEPRGSHDCILRGPKNAGSIFIQTQLISWLQNK